MRFDLKVGEVQYIQKHFHFDSLIGVEKRLLPLFGAEKSLISKGVIVEYAEKRIELNNEYRYLFSQWEKARYSVVRPDKSAPNELFCILANNDNIIIVERNGNDIALELIDYNSDVMDAILFNMAEFDSSVIADYKFNISLSVKDAVGLLSTTREANIEEWSNKLGIDKEALKFYLKAINKEDNSIMLLCEDHVEDVGTLLKIVKNENGYYALKHVTPKDSTNEKMVMIVGNAQMIVDSIYIF